MNCSQQQPLTKLLSQRQQMQSTKASDERLSNYFSMLMVLYLWFLCLCLLTVIVCPLLFIFNESLINGALTAIDLFLFCLPQKEQRTKQDSISLKGKLKTCSSQCEGEKSLWKDVCGILKMENYQHTATVCGLGLTSPRSFSPMQLYFSFVIIKSLVLGCPQKNTKQITQNAKQISFLHILQYSVSFSLHSIILNSKLPHVRNHQCLGHICILHIQYTLCR